MLMGVQTLKGTCRAEGLQEAGVPGETSMGCGPRLTLAGRRLDEGVEMVLTKAPVRSGLVSHGSAVGRGRLGVDFLLSSHGGGRLVCSRRLEAFVVWMNDEEWGRVLGDLWLVAQVVLHAAVDVKWGAEEVLVEAFTALHPIHSWHGWFRDGTQVAQGPV